MFVQPQSIVSPVSSSRPRNYAPAVTEKRQTERGAPAPNPAGRVLEGELLASERRQRTVDRRTQRQDPSPHPRSAAPRNPLGNAPQGAPPAIQVYLEHSVLGATTGNAETSTQLHILA